MERSWSCEGEVRVRERRATLAWRREAEFFITKAAIADVLETSHEIDA